MSISSTATSSAYRYWIAKRAAGSLAEALALNFAVVKAVTA